MASFLTKIAHNNRVSLGPRDTKQLQEVISSERRLVDTYASLSPKKIGFTQVGGGRWSLLMFGPVLLLSLTLNSAQRLSAERDKASEALRQWGQVEGPDLGDVLTKVCTLYDYLGKAEVAFCEHSSNSRLKFKDIRSKEETLSTLKKTRDSLAGRIEAQERKVSKMKDENKDLPNAKQRLRDMQQEMIGLENSVLTEETRLGDFKRSAVRAALSLKLGAMIELAEKTAIVAEMGKLMIDMLPTEETPPGEQRAYYDGYSRTEELLTEAQRCLEDVVFNPAPISEPFSHQAFQEGSAHPTNQFDQSGISHQQQYSDYPSEHQYAAQHQQDGSYPQQQQTTPQSQTFTSPETSTSPQTYTSPSHPQSPPHHDGTFRRNSQRRLSQSLLPEQPAPHSGPQLQPLPDFRPLSVLSPPPPTDTPAGRERDLAPLTPSDVGATPLVDGYSSRPIPVAAGAAGLAPPVSEDGWDQNRSSLAYMGEAPHIQEETQPQEEEEMEAREAREAFENEAREREEQQQGVQSASTWRYNRQDYSSPPPQESEGALESYAGGGKGGGGLAAPSTGYSTLSPIVEVATPAMTHEEPSTPLPLHQEYDYQHQQSPQQLRSSASASAIDYIPPPSAGERRNQYGEEHREPYSPPPQSPSYNDQTYTSPPHSATYAPASSQPIDPSPAPSSPVPSIPGHPPPSFTTTAPVPPPIASIPSATGATSFEPRPLTPKISGERRSIQIRSQTGEAALGSKYGDIYVPSGGGGGGGAYSPTVTSPSSGGPSGYFGASSTTSLGNGNGGDGKRTMPAGAFRRAGAQPGGGRFAPSGYGAGGDHPQPPAALERGPSESERIANAYRNSAIPLSPEPMVTNQTNPGGEGDLQTQFVSSPTSMAAPPFPIPIPMSGPMAAPAFDVRPLRVDKSRTMAQGGGGPGGGGGMTGGGGSNVGRSGTLPSHLNLSRSGGSETGSAVSQQQPPSSPRRLPYDQQPTSPGFGSNRFVTKLD